MQLRLQQSASLDQKKQILIICSGRNILNMIYMYLGKNSQLLLANYNYLGTMYYPLDKTVFREDNKNKKNVNNKNVDEQCLVVWLSY